MTDSDLLALCALQEAGGEIDDGKAAVARVIKNRMARMFFSDGTVYGTVLCRDQFSWAYFAFETVHTGTGVHEHSEKSYVRVASTFAQAISRAQTLLAESNGALLRHYGNIAQSVMAGTYSGPDYDHLTDDAVMYLNPLILTTLPKWADPAKLVCSIGHHDFYRN